MHLIDQPKNCVLDPDPDPGFWGCLIEGQVLDGSDYPPCPAEMEPEMLIVWEDLHLSGRWRLDLGGLGSGACPWPQFDHGSNGDLDLARAGYVEHEDEGSSFGNWYYPWSRDADPFVAYGPEEEGGTLAPSDSGKTAKELMAKGFVQATTEHATTAPTAPSLAPTAAGDQPTNRPTFTLGTNREDLSRLWGLPLTEEDIVCPRQCPLMRPGSQYSWAFFKALGNMIAIGFETPPMTNNGCEQLTAWCQTEYWLTMFSLYIGTLFYALLISNMSTILMSMGMSHRRYQEMAGQVDEYMRSKKLPPDLRDKVKDYFMLTYGEGKIYDESAIMNNLSPALRTEILRFTSKDLYTKVPLFVHASAGFVRCISCVIRPMVAFEGDIVVQEDTVGTEMFFVSSGVLEIFCESRITSGQQLSLRRITIGAFFGEASLMLHVRRSATVQANSTSVLYMVTRDDLYASLNDYQEMSEYMMDVAAKRVERVTQLASHELVAHRIPIDPEDEEAHIMFKEQWQNCAHGEIDGSSSHDSRRPSLLRSLSKSSVEIEEEEKALEEALRKKEEAEDNAQKAAAN